MDEIEKLDTARMIEAACAAGETPEGCGNPGCPLAQGCGYKEHPLPGIACDVRKVDDLYAKMGKGFVDGCTMAHRVAELGGLDVVEEYRRTLVRIGCMLGFEDGELPILPEMLLGELGNRLMPPGCEWPRFEDGEPVHIGDEARVSDNVGEVVSIGFYEGCWEVVIGFEGGYSHRVHVSLGDGPYVRRPAASGGGAK